MGISSVILVLTLVMPGGARDISIQLPVDSKEACWVEAREFVDRGVPEQFRKIGAVATSATCIVPLAMEDRPT